MTKPMKKLTLSQPEDWIQRWQVEAFKRNVDLSVWVGQACNAQLSEEARCKLSVRTGRGKPPRERSEASDDRYID
jgi:hypothetical protein